MKACVGVELWLHTNQNLNTTGRWVVSFRLQPPFFLGQTAVLCIEQWATEQRGFWTTVSLPRI